MFYDLTAYFVESFTAWASWRFQAKKCKICTDHSVKLDGNYGNEVI